MMKSVITTGFMPNFFALLLTLLLLPTLTEAQLTIKNDTSCPVYVQASQVDNGSGQPCTPCNVSNWCSETPGKLVEFFLARNFSHTLHVRTPHYHLIMMYHSFDIVKTKKYMIKKRSTLHICTIWNKAKYSSWWKK